MAKSITKEELMKKLPIQTRTALELPEDERGLPADRIQRWEEMRAKLSDPKVGKRIKEDAFRSAQSIENHLPSQRDAKWEEAAIAETISLAEGRGEEVDHGAISTDGQRKRPVRRLQTGGLHEAFRRGSLSQNSNDTARACQLLSIGDLYRDCYERDNAMTTPERTESMSAGAPKMAQTAVLHASQVLAVLRSGLSELQLKVLDQVCGEDLSLKRAARALKRRDGAVSRALRDGLDRAADNWLGKPENAITKKETWNGLTAAIARAQRQAA